MNNELLREIVSQLGFSLPTLPASARLRHRLAFRNERTLYKRTSSLSGKPIVSIYAPDSPHKVYSVEEWWSDTWDGHELGRDIDFTRPFFEQIQSLMLEAPRIALFNVNPYNSDFCQQAYNNKNCYLCAAIKDSQDSLYISHSNRMRDSLDCDYAQELELCYDCMDCERLYACVGCHHCQGSHELYFCLDCIGSKNCIGCWGLRNQSYCILNEQYSKEDYEAMLRKLKLTNRESYEKQRTMLLGEAWAQHPRENYNLNVEDSTGKNLIQTKNCRDCNDSFHLEQCVDCTWAFESHHCASDFGMGGCEWVYESVGIENLNVAAFTTFVSDGGYCYYSDLSFYCNDIIGCVALRRSRNSILNKAYTREEYERLREKLVGHMRETGEWGRFFPAELSPFAYNESVAQERVPLSREEARKLGYRWREPDKKDYLPAKASVPVDSAEAGEEICSALLACSATGKNFKITPQELTFARNLRLPLSDLCPDERYVRRMARRDGVR